ncbi:MAG: flagellar FliJ family protein [Sulfurospirillum sp.]|nr:flagellar FliJ family protein [Sulfurospirillum sp.]
MEQTFSQIAKIRKQKLDTIESQLLHVRRQKQDAQKELTALFEKIEKCNVPKAGKASLMSIFVENLRLLRVQKTACEALFAKLIQEFEQLQKAYKDANIELEKIRYLQQMAYKERIKKINKREKIEMDEIATMLFSNAKGG